MKDFLSVLCVLFVIVLNKCESIETGTFVDLSRTRRQALDESALPEGYTIFPNHNVAYKIYEESLPWDAARGKCKSDGGDLAIAFTADTIQFIQSMIEMSSRSYFHLGIFKPSGSLTWRTLEGTLLLTESIPWASRIQKNAHSIDMSSCRAFALHRFGLSYGWCTTSRGFICGIPTREHPGVAEVTTTTLETTTLTSTLPPPPPPPSPPLPRIAKTSRTSANSNYPDGYIEFSQFHTAYKIYDEHLTHYEARRRCFSDGGRLAVVDSFEKINAVSAMLKSESVHVGIRIGSVHFEEWVVDSNGELTKDLPWIADNPHPEKCAALRKDGSGLEETLCSNQLQYLCEIWKDNE